MGAGLGSISPVASATLTSYKTLTPSLILINFPPPATGAWFSCRALRVRPQLPFNMMSFRFWLPEPRREGGGERKEGKSTVRNNRTKECEPGCDEIHQKGEMEGCCSYL